METQNSEVTVQFPETTSEKALQSDEVPVEIWAGLNHDDLLARLRDLRS